MQEDNNTDRIKSATRQVTRSGERKIILKVLEYFENEKRLGVSIPVEKVIERTSSATGISKRSITRIKAQARALQTEQNQSEVSKLRIPSPFSQRKEHKKIDLSYSELCLTRDIINGFVKKEIVPTLSKVVTAFKKQADFPGSKETFRKVIKRKLGYHFKKSLAPIVTMPERPVEKIVFVKIEGEPQKPVTEHIQAQTPKEVKPTNNSRSNISEDNSFATNNQAKSSSHIANVDEPSKVMAAPKRCFLLLPPAHAIKVPAYTPNSEQKYNGTEVQPWYNTVPPPLVWCRTEQLNDGQLSPTNSIKIEIEEEQIR